MIRRRVTEIDAILVRNIYSLFSTSIAAIFVPVVFLQRLNHRFRCAERFSIRRDADFCRRDGNEYVTAMNGNNRISSRISSAIVVSACIAKLQVSRNTT